MLTFIEKLGVLQERRRREKSCAWTPQQLATHQQRALEELRAFAVTHSPFYARLHRGRERAPLTELPIVSKAMLMEHFDEVVTDRTIRLADAEAFLRQGPAAGKFRGRYIALATSGSTGRRGVFLFDEREWIACLANISRPMAWAHVRPRLVKRLRTAMLASTSSWHYSARVGQSFSTKLLPTLRLDAADPTVHIVEQLNGWKPDVLVAYPSVLRMLAAEQAAGRLKISPHVCATSAEVLTDETRRRVRDAFGIRVWETYGATEYAPIAAECEEGRMHLFEDGAIIEVVDDDGRAVQPGEQGTRILVTVFGRRIQPLIRYEISDMVRLSASVCPCGRPFRTIEAVEGRQEDVLSMPAAGKTGDTVSIHPNVFHRVLESVPASAWQVVQQADGLIVNLVGLKEPASELTQIESNVSDALAREGAVMSRVQVLVVDDVQRGKTGKAPLIVACSSKTAA